MTTASATRERPILFTAAMVRALLAGTKTQTRRVIKPQPVAVEVPLKLTDGPLVARAFEWTGQCPYGGPGDRLWVRETWSYRSSNFKFTHSDYMRDPAGCELVFRADGHDDWSEKWFPSIHMPRHASRISLELTELRVQRLQDISEEDAQAEGVEQYPQVGDELRIWRDYRVPDEQNSGHGYCTSAFDSFRSLWESINGTGSWDANPWVWALTFKRAGTV